MVPGATVLTVRTWTAGCTRCRAGSRSPPTTAQCPSTTNQPPSSSDPVSSLYCFVGIWRSWFVNLFFSCISIHTSISIQAINSLKTFKIRVHLSCNAFCGGHLVFCKNLFQLCAWVWGQFCQFRLLPWQDNVEVIIHKFDGDAVLWEKLGLLYFSLIGFTKCQQGGRSPLPQKYFISFLSSQVSGTSTEIEWSHLFYCRCKNFHRCKIGCKNSVCPVWLVPLEPNILIRVW